MEVRQGDRLLGLSTRCTFSFSIRLRGRDEGTGRERATFQEELPRCCHRLCVGRARPSLALFGWKVPRPSGKAAVVSGTQHAGMKHRLLPNVSLQQADQKGC